jgi:hypothetical protein
MVAKNNELRSAKPQLCSKTKVLHSLMGLSGMTVYTKEKLRKSKIKINEIIINKKTELDLTLQKNLV